MQSIRLESPKIVVLTSASNGIGEATALYLARLGHKLLSAQHLTHISFEYPSA